MRLLFAGTPAVAVPALARLLASGHEVVAVLTQPARPRGRSAQPVPSEVSAFAVERGLPVLAPERLGDSAAELERLELDLAVVVAYGQLVPPALLGLPRLGWINLHFSLLPQWRGAAPVQRALIAGDDLTGASVFQLESGLDTGPVFGTLTTSVGERETAGELLDRLSESGGELLASVVDGLAAGTLHAVPQNEGAATYAPKLTKADAEVDWSLPALAIDRLVRGCTPQPGAWTTAGGLRLELGPFESSAAGPELAVGELAAGKHEVWVGTGSHSVRLGSVKPAGGKWMAAAAWARGWREPLARLGNAG